MEKAGGEGLFDGSHVKKKTDWTCPHMFRVIGNEFLHGFAM
jgi:hypothetical protein